MNEAGFREVSKMERSKVILEKTTKIRINCRNNTPCNFANPLIKW